MQSNSKNKVIWLVILSILFSFIKVFEIPPVIPTLVSDLHISYAQAGLFMSVYAVMKCLASSPAGYISDKWGAVPLMSASLLGICIFGILGTIGDSFELLLLWRFLGSVLLAIIFIAGTDAVSKNLPPEKVGFGMGLINATIGIGITIALLVTPIISDRIGWRVNFLFTSLACGALFLYSLLLIKEEKALQPIGNARLPDSDAPYSFGKLLSNPMLILIAVSMGCLFIEVYGVTTWIPPYLTDVYQFSPSEVGLSSMMLGLVMIPAAITTGYFATNMVRILWLTLSGGVVASIGIMVLIMVQLSPWETALVISILTWGQTQAIVTVTSMASIIVPKHSAGKAIGIVFTLGYAGAILATYLGGYLVTSRGDYDVSLILFAIASTLAGVFIFMVCQMISRNPPEHFASSEVITP